MITLRHIIYVLATLLILMLWPLVGGQGGYLRVMELTEELNMIKDDNLAAFERNQRLAAEVRSLTERADAIEERARYDLNMVRPGEVLFRIQRPQRVLPDSAIPADIINDPLYQPAPAESATQAPSAPKASR